MAGLMRGRWRAGEVAQVLHVVALRTQRPGQARATQRVRPQVGPGHARTGVGWGSQQREVPRGHVISEKRHSPS